MLKVIIVMGTRPEVIKMAPIVEALNHRPAEFQVILCATAQHREMLDQALQIFDLHPDYDLDIMRPGQSLSQITACVLEGMDAILQQESPDWLLVQGDTTTVLSASLAAFHRRVKVGHVEAGLRSNDRQNPYPEEINRRIADVIANLHFAPTEAARQNLIHETVESHRIVVTGNTVIDALLQVTSHPFVPQSSVLRILWHSERKIVLVTAHRRESFGQPLLHICAALRNLAERYPDIAFVYPVHLNPHIHEVVHRELHTIENIYLLPPLDYLTFVHLMKRAYVILTDSGGIQEEAPSLGKPVLVMRQTTERKEGIDAGTAKLVGTSMEHIVAATVKLIENPEHYQAMAQAINPYGDGQASERIAQALIEKKEL